MSDHLNAHPDTRYLLSAWFCFFLIMFIFIYRLGVVFFGDMNLHFDEAQYWLWSYKPAWGYFSKPPFIAWALGVQRWLFGESEFALKLLSMMIYPLTTAVVYFITKLVYDNRTARYASLLFFTMPAVSLSSSIISTDVFLVLFWAFSVWLTVLALRQRRLALWLWVGFFSGCGLLSKYTMILFLPSFILYLFMVGQLKQVVNDPGVFWAFLFAFVLLLPNLYWNYSHEMVSFLHLYEISQLDKKRFDLLELLVFWFSQVGVLGLVTSYLFFRYCLMNSVRAIQDRDCAFWFCFFIVYIGAISAQAFLSRAFANWAAPCYVTAIIWLSHELVKANKLRLLNIAILVNLFSMCIMYHYETLYDLFDIPLTTKTDPKRHVRGWRALGTAVSPILSEHPGYLLLADNRKVLSELIYYVQPHPMNAVLFNASHELRNTFHLTQDLNQYRDQNFLWVTRSSSPEAMGIYFNKVTYVQTIVIPIDDTSVVYNVFRLDGFEGY